MAEFEIKDGVGIIPEGTTKLGWSAFEECAELTSVVIPDSVTEIGQSAFILQYLETSKQPQTMKNT